ncbi:hybrid-cluster NAD(P)-dependent oxidoreductase [Vibrio parahaemolyticus]|uniref:hybrid-cluster NAD(P)-dependent oxidoreductase n=1 Tax=Vibrio parahaemolyticus TaxID=670 RepID=UPI0009EF9446|nr:hybrid-cluster NAD(P)-dependent oxidoreductase [Vibrio parahaemolyticus]EJG0621521.1 hybrid-cluster NAD(P)-dependent oxidoreductase [Vibrio parahaemolyticus]EJG0640083.1 hybrid-cluster NAD(P)-dependent oxidoreductase [Vibrio parahaemolyticus]EJG0686996.1 hybrid-cluster NAD(P)-dependent oxidoreductase [Vibrio parahaemolyticus]EJG0699922.1 hybrid-cluster NAD(P)-dependent oxidoreductase [Vibrio parahaemolyticus]EJG0729005.1 hybrid-cluster NAD(P)-dependent oxidoreductase [Vibrio parahaemolyticu
MSQPVLSQINVFPVKSVGGVSLSSAWVEKQGLSFDRRFMIAKADGSMITARKYPQMVTVKSALLADGVVFSSLGMEPLKIRYQDFKMQETPATVWKDTFTAYTTTDDADDWFSQVLGQRVELLFSGEQSNRVRESLGQNVSFADGYPVLVISQASLEELNKRSSEQHSMDQFRTNLVVSDTKPFEEDSWKRIRIGEVEFEFLKPCERCILTTINTQRGTFRESKEPLKTLQQFRANERGGVFFGQNLVARNEGIIHQGDKVEVLEYKEPEFYPDNSPVRMTLTCVEREEIARDFVTLWLEPSKGSLPNYLPGQHLPIEVDINGKKIGRRYTLSSSPSRPGRYAISVKRIAGGRVSNALLDNLQVGDVLEAENPDGQFHLKTHDAQPLLLLSAGSGVTPMLSMVRYLADHNQLNDVVFYHQCRTEYDIPCRSELEQLKREHSGLEVKICLTQPAVDWFGLKGRLSLSHIKQIKDVEQRQVFVCGPDGFMQKAKNLLLKKGLPEAHYHQEAFGVSTVEARPEKEVEIEFNGLKIQGNNQKTLLDQIEDAGKVVSNSCRAGLCGACKVQLTSGQVHHPDVPALTDEERAMGTVLACCAIPETDVTVTE